MEVNRIPSFMVDPHELAVSPDSRTVATTPYGEGGTYENWEPFVTFVDVDTFSVIEQVGLVAHASRMASITSTPRTSSVCAKGLIG
jgi:hypothetical protein